MGFSLVALFGIVACVGRASGLVIRLEAGERECFLIEVKAEAAVSGNFELISEVSAAPLTVVVSGEATPDGSALYETSGESDGTFAFDVGGDGVIDICLANGKKRGNDGLPRTVGFAIRTSVHHADNEEGSLDALLDVSEELNEGLLTLTDHQAYMRRREENHQHTLASTRTRVLYWTIGETVVLIALSLWQIFYIRGFFETKRML